MSSIAVRKRIQVIASILVLLASVQSLSLAVSVNGSLTTASWIQKDQLDNASESQMNIALYEYLRFHAVDIGRSGVSAHISGRVAWDRYATYDEKYSGRLYQGYLDWKLSNRFDLRVGRQFILNDMGFWQMDGVRLGFRANSMSPALYAGIAVPPWTLDGDNGAILGSELKTGKLWQIRSKLSLHTVVDKDGRFDKVITGVQLDTSDMGFLDLHRVSRQRLSISARGSIDLLTTQIVSAYTSIDARLLPETHLYAEYRHRAPLFPIDSIFSTFDFGSLHQLSIGLDYKVMRFLSLQGRYARQFLESGDIDRYSAGFGLGGKYDAPFSIRLERSRDPDTDTHYWRVYSHLSKLIGQRFSISLSNYYNKYKLTRSLQSEEAYSFQLKAGYRLSRKLQAFIRLEDNISPEYEYSVRVIGYLRMGFGLKR